MLVLTRKAGEKIVINDNIVVTLLSTEPGKVRLGIEAPKDVPIARSELVPSGSKPSDHPKPAA